MTIKIPGGREVSIGEMLNFTESKPNTCTGNLALIRNFNLLGEDNGGVCLTVEYSPGCFFFSFTNYSLFLQGSDPDSDCVHCCCVLQQSNVTKLILHVTAGISSCRKEQRSGSLMDLFVRPASGPHRALRKRAITTTHFGVD